MKKTLSLVLALVMLMAMFAAVGAAEPAEAAVQPDAVEPAVQAEETEVAAAPVEEAPAEPAPETVSEPAEEPAPAAEEPAEPETPAEPEVPAEQADEPEVNEPATVESEVAEPVEEPAEEPEPVAAPPAENSLELAPEPTEEAYTVVVVHRGDGVFPAPRSEYEKLNVTLTEDGKLPDTNNEKDWYIPQRAGYTFAGWSKDTSGAVTGDMLNVGDEVEANADLYPCWKRTVVLDAEPGNFKGEAEAPNNYTRTVELDGDKLPSNMPEAPVFDISKTGDQTAEFTGWYVNKPAITKTEEGDHCVWSIQTEGDALQAGSQVPAGVTTLYAGYKVKAEAGESKQVVTYYLDWNGVNGMYGHCLACTRPYSAEAGGYTLTAGDLAVRYLNWDGESGKTFESQEQLQAYWEEKNAAGGFDGYQFLGWATTQDAEQADVVAGTTKIENGASIYAVWTKGSENSWTFDRTEKSAGPLEALRFLNLKYNVHGTQNAFVTVSPYASPVGAEMTDVEWTLTYGTPNTKYTLAPPVSLTVTVTENAPFEGKNGEGVNFGPEAGFKAEAKDGTLVITNLDGKEHTITVTVKAKAVVNGEPTGEYVSSPANAPATVSFSHNWVKDEDGEHQAPTCAAHGFDTYECTCGETYQKIIPPLEHTWKLQTTQVATCTADGIKQDQCVVCNMTFDQYQQWLKDRDKPVVNPPHKTEVIAATGHSYCGQATCTICGELGKKGDPSGDGIINTNDVRNLFLCAMNGGDGIAPEIGDVTGDGVINTNDVRVLFLAAMNDGSLPG